MAEDTMHTRMDVRVLILMVKCKSLSDNNAEYLFPNDEEESDRLGKMRDRNRGVRAMLTFDRSPASFALHDVRWEATHCSDSERATDSSRSGCWDWDWNLGD